MNRFVLAFAALASTPALAAPPTWPAMQAATWSPVAERAHDAAGTVAVLGATVADVACYKGVATVPVAPDALLAVASDVESVVDWSTAGVREAKLLARDGDTLQYYQYLDVPGWTMASDRFWFVESRTEREGDRIVYRWSQLPQGGPHKAEFDRIQRENPGAIEPPVNTGAWVFSAKDGGSLVEYYVCSDTGGSLPGMVQSAATRKTLPDTVGDLVREAKKRAQ